MHRLAALTLLAIAIAFAFSLPASAQQTLTERGRLELELSGIERLPTKATLLRVSPRAAELLREIVLRPSRNVLARNRALSALRLFPSAATARVLRAVIETNRAVKNGLGRLDPEQALGSYAAIAGPEAVETVRPFLSHPNIDVRATAASALSATRSPRALGLLEARWREEPSATVRARIDRELARLRRAPEPSPRPAVAR